MCLNGLPSCTSTILAKGLCASCYKKAYRLNNKDRLLSQERAAYDRNGNACRARSNACKRKPIGRYKTAISEAQRRGLPFALTFQEFLDFLTQPCYYCEMLESEPNTGGRLDRIENTHGYFTWNCVPCCGSCNCIRGNKLSFIEMVVVGKSLIEFRKKATYV